MVEQQRLIQVCQISWWPSGDRRWLGAQWSGALGSHAGNLSPIPSTQESLPCLPSSLGWEGPLRPAGQELPTLDDGVENAPLEGLGFGHWGQVSAHQLSAL